MTHERKSEIAAALSALLVAVLAVVCVLCAGCAYKGGKIVEGTDIAVGLSVPSTDGTLQLDLLNYLSGFRLGVAENAALRVRYTVAESNDFLGVVHTRVSKTIDAKVEPCEVTPTDTNGETLTTE